MLGIYRLCVSMKFAQPLLEGTLLKRQFRFLAEIALGPKQKRMIHCPHQGPLKSCEILGSRLWFSKALAGFSACLDSWELTEIDGGVLVNMNPAYNKILVREAVLQGLIPELVGFQCLKQRLNPGMGIGLELFWKDNGEQCFVHMEPLWASDKANRCFGPEQPGVGRSALEDLITVKKLGHQAVLLYCIQHTEVESVSLAEAIEPHYRQLLETARQQGVEIVAYGLNISLEGMALDRAIPLVWEDIHSY